MLDFPELTRRYPMADVLSMSVTSSEPGHARPAIEAWPQGRGNFWGAGAGRWPRATQAPRSYDRLHSGPAEHRATEPK
jgi:hypothetical protein